MLFLDVGEEVEHVGTGEGYVEDVEVGAQACGYAAVELLNASAVVAAHVVQGSEDGLHSLTHGGVVIGY